jgi:GT2 family glycosyltransferase
LGLTFARLRGFAEAKGELIVMVDDDNVLAPDYLETAVRIAEEHPMLGAFGGKSLPEFAVEPPEWLAARGKGLGLRDRGEREEFFPEATITESWQLADGRWQGGENGKPPTDHLQRRAVREFPDCAPIGAGMVLRRDAAAAYAERIEQRTTGPRDNGTITDRKGDSLASGGDNDICLTVIEEGWQVGYLPSLQLTHLIPKGRMTLDYHRRMARDSIKSYILMLDQHGIRPWPAMAKWTLPLRVASDWWRVKPWLGPEQSLCFWGNLGMYEGRELLAESGTR